jgi:hypothetical protein
MEVRYDALFTLVYTVVDDWYQREGARLVRERPGVKPRFSDSEVLTVEVVRTLEGQRSERRWHRMVQANWQALFGAAARTERAAQADQESLPTAGPLSLLGARPHGGRRSASMSTGRRSRCAT